MFVLKKQVKFCNNIKIVKLNNSHIICVKDKIILLKSEINSGYAGGCNLGATKAKGKFLLFLNNDTTHDKNFINPLIEKLESNQNIACVQPKIKNLKNKNYFDYAGASGGFIDYLVFPFCRGRIFNTIERDE